MTPVADPRNRDDERAVVTNLSPAILAAEACRRWLWRDKVKACAAAWSEDDYKGASRIIDELHEQIQAEHTAGRVTRRMADRIGALMDHVIAIAVPLGRLAAWTGEAVDA